MMMKLEGRCVGETPGEIGRGLEVDMIKTHCIHA